MKCLSLYDDEAHVYVCLLPERHAGPHAGERVAFVSDEQPQPEPAPEPAPAEPTDHTTSATGNDTVYTTDVPTPESPGVSNG